ncbi:hypothetical protein KI387_021271, partial [Taxus chinensis]
GAQAYNSCARCSWRSRIFVVNGGYALGATVIGTVPTKEKAAQAIGDGCHHPIIYNQEDFVDCVKKLQKDK